MSLDSGTRLGPYTIEAPIGAGGMGEVYKAQDTRLGRMVAIKVLPESVAGDPERLGRFEREAKLLASLNHPHIAALYGLEESGGVPALVMELVEGPTLEDRIRQGALPLDETLKITRQIAEAVEYAHAHGIIHRDLKPANVKLTADDRVKVLDFGLAKALDPATGASGSIDLSHSPTLTYQATMAGVILGTAAYMSPEQARGKAVDKQADVWALGCLVYEMLTGERAFAGETVSDTLAAVLRGEPDWEALPSRVGARLRRVLARCLEKDPKQRFHSALDVAIELEGAATRDADSDTDSTAHSMRSGRQSLPWLVATICLVAACVLGFIAYRATSRTGVVPPVTRLNLELPAGERLTLPDTPNLAISPDGRRVAVVLTNAENGVNQIFVRNLADPSLKPVAGTEGALSPFFSPDGQQIAFFADGKLKRVSVHGRELAVLADAASVLADASQPRGGVWTHRGSIIFSPAYVAGLVEISSNGGVPKTLLVPDPAKKERTYRWPGLLPNDRGVLFTIGWLDSPNSYETSDIAVLDLETGKAKTIIKGGTYARFIAPGRLIYLRNGSLVTVPFDVDSLEVRGEPSPVNIDVGGDPTSGVVYLAVARDGTLAWVPGAMSLRAAGLSLVDRDGEESPLDVPQQSYHYPAFSPDGQTIAFNVGQGLSGREGGDIWLWSLKGRNLTRLTFGGHISTPIFSPDGKQVAYSVGSGDQAGLFRKAVDGSNAETPIGKRSPQPRLLASWSPDGKSIAYTAFTDATDTYLMDVSTGKTRLFAKHAGGAKFSPDGKYLTYTEVPAEGPVRIMVHEVSGDGQWQVSPGRGAYSYWSADGSEIFYVSEDKLMRVPVTTDPTFRAGSPEPLFGNLQRFSYQASVTNYAVSPDGQHFVFVTPDQNGQSDKVALALNWAQNLGDRGGS
jgi:serine/threonine protein kinase/Tol biopolymer transport system component